jgi:hypothetical protein
MDCKLYPVCADQYLYTKPETESPFIRTQISRISGWKTVLSKDSINFPEEIDISYGRHF